MKSKHVKFNQTFPSPYFTHRAEVKQLVPERAAGQIRGSLCMRWEHAEGDLPATSLQEVTLMKNSVVCSSCSPSGMNK